jgi:septal ring factor EnvC (AmiA/AmiB activator)
MRIAARVNVATSRSSRKVGSQTASVTIGWTAKSSAVARASGEGIVAPVSSLPSDAAAAAALTRFADELAALRASLDTMNQRLAALTDENARLRHRLEQSEAARADLVAQTEHIVELLADSRRELRALQSAPPS